MIDFNQQFEQGVLLGDGAMGTMLQQQGLQSGECPELWNLEKPERVRQVAEFYIQAGAQSVITNTFGGSSLKLQHYHLEHKAAEINRRGAEIACQAAGKEVWVAGSIGPTGEFLAPLGTISEEQIYQSFLQQAEALAAGGVDFIQVETMSDLQETRLAITATQAATRLPVLVSMTFSKGYHGYRTMMGVSPAQMVQTFEPLGVAVLGSNCGNGMDEIIEIICELRTLTQLPLLAAPNAGLPQMNNGEIRYSQDGDYFAARVAALVTAGANYIKGCCGTTPEHIQKMSQQLASLKQC